MKRIGIAMGILIVAVCVIGLVRWLWISRDGPCVCVEPREIAGGAIWDEAVGYPRIYMLRYRGDYLISGKPCQVPLHVTEAEYSRKMYRED